MPPEVPWPRPTMGSRPEIFEYEPKTSVPPVTGALVVGGVVAAFEPPVFGVDVPSPSSPHAVASKPMAATTTSARCRSFMLPFPSSYGSPPCDQYLTWRTKPVVRPGAPDLAAPPVGHGPWPAVTATAGGATSA